MDILKLKSYYNNLHAYKVSCWLFIRNFDKLCISLFWYIHVLYRKVVHWLHHFIWVSPYTTKYSIHQRYELTYMIDQYYVMQLYHQTHCIPHGRRGAAGFWGAVVALLLAAGAPGAAAGFTYLSTRSCNRSCCENNSDVFHPGSAEHLPFAAAVLTHTCIPNDLYSTLWMAHEFGIVAGRKQQVARLFTRHQAPGRCLQIQWPWSESVLRQDHGVHLNQAHHSSDSILYQLWCLWATRLAKRSCWLQL